MARVQDRVMPFPVQAVKSFQTTLPCRPNGVCTNKEGTYCAVGGRNLLKVFNIEDNNFVEKHNLVVGPKKLNYSITDVQWHPFEDNLIASSAGNGVVILWDLNKVGNESKQDHIFQHHYRFANKLCFHPTDGALLMSCSQDGNMHLFDVRQKKLVDKFRGKTDGVRDIQFHPTDRNVFCAACESGNVQLWDIRKPDNHYNQFIAHRGPVFTLNWHPDDRFLLCTGGRDTSIKIWDTQLRTHPKNIIQTIAPVACVKWRPNYKHHIASCALFLDNNVTIWDIKRPYVPFATFEEHSDITTGIVWQKDPDVIISCSKDKLLYNHALSDAKKPAEHASPVALDVSPSGFIGHALTDKLERFSNLKSNLTSSKSPSQQVSASEFKPEKSSLRLFTLEDDEVSDEVLIGVLAKEYKFYGKPFGTLCDHNASVAVKHGLTSKAFTWSILKQFYMFENNIGINDQHQSPTSLASIRSITSEKVRILDTPDMFHQSLSHDMSNHLHISSEDDEEDEDENGVLTPSTNQVNVDITMVGPEFAVFYDEDCNDQLFSADLETEENELEFLPDEAIQLRQSFGENAVQQRDNDFHDGEYLYKSDQERQLSLSELEIPDLEFEESVRDMLYFYAERGDIQMAVTSLLVLQHRGKNLISSEEQEDWYRGYLDILYQLQLFNVATEVINHSPEPICTLNHNSTTIHMQCQDCNKPIPSAKPGCYCPKCQKITQKCAVCRIPVKGLLVWCQGCGHGGHLKHMKEWFGLNTNCPTGCGHKCEFS